MNQLDDAEHLPNLHQLTWTFVPFTLLWAIGVFGGLVQQSLGSIEIARSVHFIWGSLILATPALMLYFWQAGRQPLGRTWRLLWTFSFLLYLAHLYYSYVILFQADFFAVLNEQGIFVGLSNFIVTLVWLFDVVLSWATRTYRPFIAWLRLLAHIGVAASFYVSAILFKTGTVQIIGYISVALVVLVILVRLLAGKPDEEDDNDMAETLT